MRHELTGARDAVPLDEIVPESRDRAIDQHEWHAVARQQFEVRLRAVADRGDEQAVHLEGEHILDVAALTLEIGLSVAENDVVAGAPGRLLRSTDNEGEERVRDVRDDHADRVRRPLDQAAREPVGDISELRDRALHAAARLVTHAGAVIEHPRDRHRGDADLASDIPDCDPHTGPRLTTRERVTRTIPDVLYVAGQRASSRPADSPDPPPRCQPMDRNTASHRGSQAANTVGRTL